MVPTVFCACCLCQAFTTWLLAAVAKEEARSADGHYAPRDVAQGESLLLLLDLYPILITLPLDGEAGPGSTANMCPSLELMQASGQQWMRPWERMDTTTEIHGAETD